MALKVAAVWFIGFNLRTVIWALPPALPYIQRDLNLSYTVVGLLGALPLLCLAASAFPGAYLGRRLGYWALVAPGLGVAAVASAFRVFSPPVWVLAMTTIVSMLFAGAVQPAISAVVRSWFPVRRQAMMSLYASGLTFGGLVAAGITPFLVVAMGWRGTFVLWSIPIAIAAVMSWFIAHPKRQTARRASDGSGHTAGLVAAGALYGFANLIFYTVITWVPFLRTLSSPSAVAAVLLLTNVAGLLATVALAFTKRSFATSRGLYWGGAGMGAGAMVALGLGRQEWVWVLAPAVGFATALVAIAVLALPTAISRGEDDAAFNGAVVLTVGTLLTFIGPFLAGIVIDRVGSVSAGFIPAAGLGMLMLVLIPMLPRGVLESGAPGTADATLTTNPF